MREIKFRAWNSVTRKMMRWDDIKRFGNLTKLISLNHVIVCQFTGLHDKNGKEIYEGDIDSDGFVFEYNVNMGSWYRMKGGKGFQWDAQSVIQGKLPFEIIRNVHENPDLL